MRTAAAIYALTVAVLFLWSSMDIEHDSERPWRHLLAIGVCFVQVLAVLFLVAKR